MRRLTVLYDARCGFCSACRRWLEGQRQLVALEFVAAGSAEARRLFPTLAAETEELIVISDDGDIYRGAHAWILCLWALDEYRDWSFRLARPALLPWARDVFEWVSKRRRGLSWLLGIRSDHELAAVLSARRSCESGLCGEERR